MRFRHFDQLRGFCVVARHQSFTSAAGALSLTKGAISHQIDGLESDLGLKLFERSKSGIRLTAEGSRLLRVADLAFASMEQEIDDLKRRYHASITIGMATYFASRWLSPRLMRFITEHEGTALRIQPVVGNPDLRDSGLDMMIRWGKGDWREPGMTIEKILACPAMLAADAEVGARIESLGLESQISGFNLLHDADNSDAWDDWFEAAGIAHPRQNDALMIPDPNVRVQAVIDGQGVALYDELVTDEVDKGKLYLHRQVKLENYGYYLVYPSRTALDSPIREFRDWITAEASMPASQSREPPISG